MRLHPASVPYRAVSRGASVAISLFFFGSVFAGAEIAPVGGPLLGVLLGAAGFLAVAAWEVAYYRRFEYDLTADSLELRSGVASRRNREIPLRRVQNVDIERNVVQRALGIARVSLETAGGGETEASLRFVGFAEAKRLQEEIGRRKRGEAAPTGEAVGSERPGPDRDLVFALPDRDLVLLSLVSMDTRLVPILVLVLPFLTARIPRSLAGVALFLVAVGVIALSVLGLWVTSIATVFSRYYGFRLFRVGDELRYERGLLQRYDGTIPLDKVQVLSIDENVLKRRFGYATLAIETAGYSGENGGGGSQAAVPLAGRDRVFDLARSVEAFAEGAFMRPPRRARRRYAVRYTLALVGLAAALYALDAFVVDIGLWWTPAFALPFAPLAAHLKWQNRGFYVGDDHVVTRNGFWRRTTKIVPAYRVQTVIQRQTVFQRRWDLASVVVDTAGARSLTTRDAVAPDLDVETAALLRETIRRTMRESRLRRARGGRTAGSASEDANEASDG